jgi:hypothetical protein
MKRTPPPTPIVFDKKKRHKKNHTKKHSNATLSDASNSIRRQTTFIQEYMQCIHKCMDHICQLHHHHVATIIKMATTTAHKAAECADATVKNTQTIIQMHKLLLKYNIRAQLSAPEKVNDFVIQYSGSVKIHLKRITYLLTQCKTVSQQVRFITGYIVDRRVDGRSYLELLRECDINFYIRNQTMFQYILRDSDISNSNTLFGHWQRLDGTQKNFARVLLKSGKYDDVLRYIGACNGNNEASPEKEDDRTRPSIWGVQSIPGENTPVKKEAVNDHPMDFLYDDTSESLAASPPSVLTTDVTNDGSLYPPFGGLQSILDAWNEEDAKNEDTPSPPCGGLQSIPFCEMPPLEEENDTAMDLLMDLLDDKPDGPDVSFFEDVLTASPSD